jgi:hypothetical protein
VKKRRKSTEPVSKPTGLWNRLILKKKWDKTCLTINQKGYSIYDQRENFQKESHKKEMKKRHVNSHAVIGARSLTPRRRRIPPPPPSLLNQLLIY